MVRLDAAFAAMKEILQMNIGNLLSLSYK